MHIYNMYMYIYIYREREREREREDETREEAKRCQMLYRKLEAVDLCNTMSNTVPCTRRAWCPVPVGPSRRGPCAVVCSDAPRDQRAS